MPLTPEQSSAVAATGNVAIRAVAGSGKTRILVERSRALRYPHLCLSFNRAIANEMTERISHHAKVFTFNSLGAYFASQALGRSLRVDHNKIRNFLKPIKAKPVREETQDLIQYMSTNCAMPPNWPRNTIRTITTEELQDFPASDIEIAFAYWTHAYTEATKGRITFDEQLLIPIWEDFKPSTIPDPANRAAPPLPLPRTVMVDEAQDLNAVQHYFLEMINPGTICVVGDPHQAIYGWRGALPDSYAKLIKKFQCTEYPLTVNWRCSAEVIHYAQRFVPELCARPDVPRGAVINKATFNAEDWHQPSAVICRNNAPLLTLAMDLIFNHKRFPTLRAKAGNEDGFLAQLKKAYIALDGATASEKQIAVAKAEEIAHKKLKGTRLERRLDLLDCLQNLIVHNPTTTQLDRMFTSEDPELILTTGHRSKGLEFENVFFLRRDLCPSKWARTDDELVQEDNLHYVIATRAKQSLHIHEDFDER